MKLSRASALALMLGAGAARAQPPPPEAPPPAAPAPSPAIAVKGRVIDSQGKPIAGAKVGLEGATERVETDKEGRFTLSAPVGATLVVESSQFQVGLATVTGAKLDDIVLLTEGQVAETIEVSGEAPPAAPGAATIDRGELQRIPGAGGDLVKALTVMPGVVNLQIPLGYSGVVIRGSSPQDSKVFVDGFEIPVLFHNIGFRAILPAESIASLDYIPGGFDVRYGRASSGIVSLETRPGSDQRTTQAEVSLIDGGLLAQGKAGERTHYMLGFRRSTIDLVLPSLIPASADLSLTTVPSYYDGQLRIDHDLSSRWRLFLSTIGTNDVFELYATKDEDARTKRFYNNTRFVRATVGAQYHEGPWSAKLALSGIAQQFVFEAGLYQRVHVEQPSVTPRVEVTRTADEWAGLSKLEWRVGAE